MGILQSIEIILIVIIPLPECTETQILVDKKCVDLPVDVTPVTDPSLCADNQRFSYGQCTHVDKLPIPITCVGSDVRDSDFDCKASAFFRSIDKLAGGLPLHLGDDFILPPITIGTTTLGFTTPPLYFGTISLVVNDNNNNLGMLISSHISDRFDNAAGYVMTNNFPLTKQVGKVSQDVNVFNKNVTHTADVAFVKINSDLPVLKNVIIDERGNQLQVIKKASISDLNINDHVKLSGSVTHSDGILLGLDHNSTAAVTDYSNGETISYVLINQGKSTYTSTKGDSGGPVYIDHNNGTATYVGINGGFLCVKHPGGVSLLLHGCPTVYSFFSHWENIRNSLDLNE